MTETLSFRQDNTKKDKQKAEELPFNAFSSSRLFEKYKEISKKTILASAGIVFSFAASQPPQAKAENYNPSQTHPALSCPKKMILSIAPDPTRRIPVIPVHINGYEANLILDTGATDTVLSQKSAERMNLKKDPYHLSSVGGVGSWSTKRLNDVFVNSITISGYSAQIPKLHTGFVAPPNMPDIDGVLGADILSGLDIDLNIPENRITLWDTSGCSPEETPSFKPGLQIREHPGSGVLYPYTVNGLIEGIPVIATIDTGSTKSLLSSNVPERAKIQYPKPNRYGTTAYGPSGNRIETSPVKITSADFAWFHESHFPMLLYYGDLPNNVDVILGMNWLSKHHIWISTRTAFMASP